MKVNLRVEIFLKSRLAGIVLIVNRWNAEPTKFGHNKSKYICTQMSAWIQRQGLTLQMVSHQKCNLAASSERQRNNYILKFSFHFHEIQFRNKSCTFLPHLNVRPDFLFFYSILFLDIDALFLQLNQNYHIKIDVQNCLKPI